MDTSTREILVLLHVLAAIVWVGGGFLTLVWGERAVRATDQSRLESFVDNWEWSGLRLFMPSAIALVVFGVWLVIAYDVYEFSDTWISIGFAVWIISFIIGAAYYGPQGRKLDEEIADGGVNSAAVRRRLGQIRMVGWIEMALLVIVVWAMVAKPGA